MVSLSYFFGETQGRWRTPLLIALGERLALGLGHCPGEKPGSVYALLGDASFSKGLSQGDLDS